jgi:sortase A
MISFKKNLPLFFESIILFLIILGVFYIFWNWNILFSFARFRLKQIVHQKNYNENEVVAWLEDKSIFSDQIIIPKIGVRAKVLWDPNKEKLLEELKNGIIHYPESEFPGEKGNIILIGHSSGIPADAGKYDNVFSLLFQLKKGDRITLYFKGNQFNYSVFRKKIIRSDFKDLKLNSFGDSNLVLITCWPLGTNFRRLAVLAREI